MIESTTRDFMRAREARAGRNNEHGGPGGRAPGERAPGPPRAVAIGPAVPADAAQRILARVSERAGADGSAGHLAQQAKVRLDGHRLSVTVPTGFLAELIEKRFGPWLIDAAREELAKAGNGARDVELAIQVDPRAFGGEGKGPATTRVVTPAPADSNQARAKPVPARPSPNVLRYRLEDFIVGEANRLAYSAAERLADPASPKTFSPLFIHGSCGLGKTHLLQGIAQRFRERRPSSSRAGIRYMTAEAFTNEYVGALRQGRLDTFRKAYRSVELLCLDDVQFLSNKVATQAELLHTFDAIDLSGAKVALASDEHPRHVRKFSEGLVSRFMSGMVVRLDPPDPELRQRIVAHLAARRGMTLEPAAIHLLASRGVGPEGSVRDLEGVLMRLDALTRLLPGTSELASGSGGAIGLVLVRKALGLHDDSGRGGGGGPGGMRRPIRIETIIDEVCRTLHIQLGDFVGRGRHKRVVLARAMTAHLARDLTTLSYPEIARAMGRPNHSTIVTAHQRIKRQIEASEPVPEGDWSGPGAATGNGTVNGLTIGGLCDQVRRDIQRLPAV